MAEEIEHTDPNDPPASFLHFKYLQDMDATPSESVKKLLSAISIKNMAFMTDEAFDSRDFRKEQYVIHTVSIPGMLIIY